MKTFGVLLAMLPAALSAPQGAFGPPPVIHPTKLVGDGNPHQWYKYKQVTGNVDCGDGDCSSATSKTTTYSLNWGASLKGKNSWAGFDFGVSISESTGQVETCSGGKGDTVCVYWRQAYTAYSVQDYKVGTDGNLVKDGDRYTMWSPNKDEVGSGHVCGRNDRCKQTGNEFWGSTKDTKAPPGGPRPYPSDYADFS
ncbi:hypothetical protein F4777DRAFT_581564 [Nemania sp. FL0916]|nr:hypothetical protein F4777DRAFT_581564 [Nemania sp. FL0916]